MGSACCKPALPAPQDDSCSECTLSTASTSATSHTADAAAREPFPDPLRTHLPSHPQGRVGANDSFVNALSRTNPHQVDGASLDFVRMGPATVRSSPGPERSPDHLPQPVDVVPPPRHDQCSSVGVISPWDEWASVVEESRNSGPTPTAEQSLPPPEPAARASPTNNL